MVPLRTFYTLEIPSSQTACRFLVTHIQSKGSSKGSRSSSSREKKKKKKVLATGLQFIRFWPQPPLRPQQSAPHPSPFLTPPLGNWQSPVEETASELYSMYIMLNTKKCRKARLPYPASVLNGGVSLNVLSFSHPLL